MFVFPRWLKVSGTMSGSHFDSRDWDATINEIFQCVNGNLTDENFREVPYYAIKWWSHVKDKTNEAPSWRGHIHDGVSARRLGEGSVNNTHIDYDGSLGLLSICEGDNEWNPFYGLECGYSDTVRQKTWLDGPQPSVFYSGKFSFDPALGGTFSMEESDFYECADRIYARVVLPFDRDKFPGGHLFNPVVTCTLQAEMSRDTFPESGLENEDATETSDDRYTGMGVAFHSFARWRGLREARDLDPGDIPSRYFILISIIVPPARHPITLGVSRWWVHWTFMGKVGKGEPED